MITIVFIDTLPTMTLNNCLAIIKRSIGSPSGFSEYYFNSSLVSAKRVRDPTILKHVGNIPHTNMVIRRL